MPLCTVQMSHLMTLLFYSPCSCPLAPQIQLLFGLSHFVCFAVPAARIDKNSFYFAFLSYLIFQDFTEQMIGKIILVSKLNHKVPVFANDCLLLLENVGENYFDI